MDENIASQDQYKPRVMVFIDGQNLFHTAKSTYGYTFPNYDPRLLGEELALLAGGRLVGINFYTGVPSPDRDPHYAHFWEAKMAKMGRDGVRTYATPLLYHSNGTRSEKGIDLRMGLDAVRAAYQREYDIFVPVTEDSDQAQTARMVLTIAKEQKRWIEVRFARLEGSWHSRIPIGREISISREMYDRCLDDNAYGLTVRPFTRIQATPPAMEITQDSRRAESGLSVW